MIQLQASGAQISFFAPLTFNGTVDAGQVIYDDMFTIYPYENQLYVVRMKGSEIRDYLEYSYDGWIQTPGQHVLRIENRPDPRTDAPKWSFVGRTYNFDSAAGLVYTVNVTKPFGKRVQITSFPDGTPFKEDAWYNVAMTSYRASGGGEILLKGAGLSKEEAESRIVERLPEIREMVYQCFKEHGTVDTTLFGKRSVLGEWHFVPEKLVGPLMEKDLALIF
jgi:2',3'-cyclic-nucleotide 2'-phosphodiesterase/3'-nucleotidase